ncbi:MAG: tetratricopeptide repeat protein, partial [Bacteroidota bacterium]
MGHYEAAEEAFQTCLKIWEDLGQKDEYLSVKNYLAWTDWRQGKYQRSMAYSKSAIEQAQLENNTTQLAKAKNNLAWVYAYLGWHEKAAKLQRQVLDIHLKNQYKKGVAFAQTNLAWALACQGKFMEAKQLLRSAIQCFDALKNVQMCAFARFVEAEFEFHQENFEKTHTALLQFCLPQFTAIHDSWGQTSSHLRLADIYLKTQDFANAEKHLIQTIDINEHANDRFNICRTHLRLNELYRRQVQVALHDDVLAKGMELAQELGSYILLQKAHFEQSQYEMRENRIQKAQVHLVAAHYFASQQGAFVEEKFQKQIAPILQTTTWLNALKLEVEPNELEQSLSTEDYEKHLAILSALSEKSSA